jgi:hypothetical protein
MLATGIGISPFSRAGFGYLLARRTQLREICGDWTAAWPSHVTLTGPLPKQCQNIGSENPAPATH